MKYLVIIEETGDGFAAYTPDIDGCFATGTSTDEVERNIHAVMKSRLTELKRERTGTPCPRSYPHFISISQ